MLLTDYQYHETPPTQTEYRRALVDIAAGLAHEVRNPLSLVKANIDLLESRETGAGAAKQYKLIRRELERINDLMAEFIEFSRQKPARKAPFRPAPAARQMLESFAEAYRDITFSYDCRNAEAVALGDAEQISRVLMNLLKNAVEAVAMTDTPGEIRLSVAKKGGMICMTVTDNGAGVTPEEAEKLTLPFYTTKSGGTGLGLYVCASIAKEHGGQLAIRPHEGGGAEAAISLPIFTEH